MEDSQERSIKKPIMFVVVAALIGICVSVLSLGILAPLGVLMFLLSIFLFGFWLLLNRTGTYWKVFAGLLIVLPVMLIISFIVRALIGSL